MPARRTKLQIDHRAPQKLRVVAPPEVGLVAKESGAELPEYLGTPAETGEAGLASAWRGCRNPEPESAWSVPVVSAGTMLSTRGSIPLVGHAGAEAGWAGAYS
jgi:hypothetical protein